MEQATRGSFHVSKSSIPLTCSAQQSEEDADSFSKSLRPLTVSILGGPGMRVEMGFQVFTYLTCQYLALVSRSPRFTHLVSPTVVDRLFAATTSKQATTIVLVPPHL
jgi:hypothetical protein